MKNLLALIIFSLIPVLGFSQQSAKSAKREIAWVYDVDLIKDETGKVVKVDKAVFSKGTPGAPVKIRWFETTIKRDASGIITYSIRETIGENNVDPELVKRYGNN